MNWIACLIPIGAALAAAFVDAPPQTAAECVDRGMQAFQANKIAESLRDFDRAAELDPAAAPFLWQRGISDYYAGKFQEGRRQFESHKRSTPTTSRTRPGISSAWRERTVSTRLERPSSRSTSPAIRACRWPKSTSFMRGEALPRPSWRRRRRKTPSEPGCTPTFISDCMTRRPATSPRARDHLRQAAAARLEKDYMHNVAKIHLLQRKWDR